MSKSLEEDAKAAKKSLKGHDDKATFDKAYIDQQVTMHESALATLNNNLIPNAKNPNLKAHLEATRDAVTAHLNHAKTIQSKMQ